MSMMTANWKSALLFSIGFICLAGIARSQQGYRPPNLEKRIFDVDQLDLDVFDRAGLTSALVSVGNDFNQGQGVDFELRAQALAIASRIDKDDKELATTLKHLKEDGKTYGAKGDKVWVSRCLASGIRALTRKKDNEANQICAAYCADIASRLAPVGPDSDRFKQQLADLNRAGRKADWTEMLGDVIRHAPNPWEPPDDVLANKEVVMPAGNAKSFVRNQSRINSLVVRQLPNGSTAGAASAVNATALRESGQKGLMFTFNQKVGPMMGGSLEEVIKFLRVRYDDKPERIPDGYRIELGFEDKYLPKDGPSAATAFSLVLDSLFSGEELDDGFACTGDITADGMVQKIGGTAGKIRGATKRGCRIVGIPVRNGKEVADVLLLDGPQQLLDIQIFTLKNFDEAYAISRKTKTPEVQKGLDSFVKIAEVLKRDGLNLLGGAPVQTRLAAVLETMPNHLSARLLMEYGKGSHPKVLSLGGSFNEIEVASSAVFRQLMAMLRPSLVLVDGELRAAPGAGLEVTTQQREEARKSVAELRRLLKHIDPRLKPYNESVLEICEGFADGPRESEDPNAYARRLKAALDGFQSVRSSLQEDVSIMEEILD